MFLDESRRHTVLYLAIRLTTLYDAPWALAAGHKFLLLLCHLVSVEVRMALENKSYKQVKWKNMYCQLRGYCN